MDFIDKKENLANLIELYIIDKKNKDQLILKVNELFEDSDFKGKDLFENILDELNNFLDELSNKELKQRILLIRSYIE